MIVSPANATVLSLLVPLIGFFAIWATGKSPNLREAMTLITGLVLMGLTFIVFGAVGAGARPGYLLFTVVGGLPIAFQAEPLGAMFAVLASVLWFVNSLYSIGYMRGHDEKHQTRFYMCFAIAIASAMGVARMPTQGSWRPVVITSTGLPCTSIERPGMRRLEVGLKAVCTTISCPELIPPRMPPA